MLSVQVKRNSDFLEIIMGGERFVVPDHWFWKELDSSWEHETHMFFERNLVPGSLYLDFGAWVGPTAMMATALGAGRLRLIEPNPVSFANLLDIQSKNNLFEKWRLINACVSGQRGFALIGPLVGVIHASSATSIRNNIVDGAEVISLKLCDLIIEAEACTLAKIDIEGAEEDIIGDLKIFSRYPAAIWLSIHPPFFKDRLEFLQKLLALGVDFRFVNGRNEEISDGILEERILSEIEFPPWGTKWGNFFEIGLLPRIFFGSDGGRAISRGATWI